MSKNSEQRILAQADESRSSAGDLERLAQCLEDIARDARSHQENATRIILAYYNICRDLGHTTPVMTDAREFLRQYAPQEVW